MVVEVVKKIFLLKILPKYIFFCELKSYSFIENLSKNVPKNTKSIKIWNAAWNANALVNLHFYIHRRR